MDVRGIVKKYLDDNKFDGLWSPEDCACEKDNLFPCDGPNGDCLPGHKTECHCGDGHDYHIGIKDTEDDKFGTW